MAFEGLDPDVSSFKVMIDTLHQVRGADRTSSQDSSIPRLMEVLYLIKTAVRS